MDKVFPFVVAGQWFSFNASPGLLTPEGFQVYPKEAIEMLPLNKIFIEILAMSEGIYRYFLSVCLSLSRWVFLILWLKAPRVCSLVSSGFVCAVGLATAVGGSCCAEDGMS